MKVNGTAVIFVVNNFIISLHPKRSLGAAKIQQQITDTPPASLLHIAIGVMRFSSYFYLENLLDFEHRLSDLEDELQRQGSDQYAYLSYDTHEHVINDLDDRFDRLSSLTKMHYDICGDLVDGYLSISVHQLNVGVACKSLVSQWNQKILASPID